MFCLPCCFCLSFLSPCLTRRFLVSDIPVQGIAIVFGLLTHARAVLLSFALYHALAVSIPWHDFVPAFRHFPVTNTLRAVLNIDWWQCPSQRGVDEVVLLSDGGHTENLGLLPLLEVRSARILCIDNSSDPDEVCEDLYTAMDKARRFFGCQFSPPPGWAHRYTDTALYMRDVLLLSKPTSFLLSVTYADGSTGLLLHLRTRHAPSPECTRCHTDVETPSLSHSHSPQVRHAANEAAVLRAVQAALASKRCGTGGSLGDPTGVGGVASPAMEDHYQHGHVNVAAATAEDLAGFCCNCCHRNAACRWAESLWGRFPNINSSQLWFTPTLHRAFHREGYCLVRDAVAAHTSFFDGLQAMDPVVTHQRN